MFAVTVVFSINPDQTEAFRELISTHAARTLLQEKGCRRFDIGFDVQKPNCVFLYELFDDRDAFDQHSKADYLAQFFERAKGMIASKEASRWDIPDTATASAND